MTGKKRVLVLVIVCALLLTVGIGPGLANPARALPRPSAEQAGTTIPYAGRLNGEAGQPAADGRYDFRFTLYGAVSGGQALWSEMQRGIVVSKGEFLTSLGSIEPIPATALKGQNLWLAVSVRGPGEAGFTALSPRQQVTVVAPAAPTAGAACPHDHLGEWWTGDPGTGNNGIRIESTRTDSNGITGVAHNGANSTGVFGWSTQGIGVSGHSSNIGVYGKGGSVGVYGHSDSSYAGRFAGSVHVVGTLSKTAGGFKIDHPLDPANKYLYHSFVESPDMKNVYDDVAVLNANGEAWVELPAWFEALNKDFRYQLTPIGSPGPNLYIAQEIQNNRFQIAGGTSGLKVSWQVTGIRHDPYAEAHPLSVEEDKPAEERGTYLHPIEHGQPATSGLDYRWNERLATEGE